MTADLDQDDIAWLRKYAKDVTDEYSARFQKSGTKFPDWKKSIERFQATVDVVIDQGRSHFHAVDEAHNELCIADGILATGQFAQLDYTPLASAVITLCDDRLRELKTAQCTRRAKAFARRSRPILSEPHRP